MKLALTILLLMQTVVCSSQDVSTPKVELRHGYFESVFSKRNETTSLEEKLEPFYHGVASGDPTERAVVIWTRVTPRNADASVNVRWVVALDTGLTQVVMQGATTTTAEADYTVKVDVQGLQSNTTFYYAFQAYNKVSLIGRTRTFPASGGDQARFAVVSCSNYPAGYFNAYGAIAKRNDLDAVLHLGDYIYEYSADSTSYAGGTGKKLGRMHSPNTEIVSLADYRARYSQYRLDPDLRSMHQQHPMMHIYDDHESANDSYADGAENHQPSEGDWQVRKGLSRRACAEWMPTRENADGSIYRSMRYGNLADVVMLDTRLDGRDQQIEDLGENASAASKEALNNPNRKLISQKQFDWLASTLRSSDATWHVIGNQVLFTQFDVSPIDTAYMFKAIGPVYTAFLRPQLPALQDLIESAFYGDVWSNYPAQRAELCRNLTLSGVRNMIVTTGDFHCSFAADIDQTWKSDTASVGVEFVTPSVTSPNFDENLGTQAFLRPILPQLLATIDTTLYSQNPHLHWSDIVNHGYQILNVTKDSVQADWYFLTSITTRSAEESWAKGYRVRNGVSRALPALSSAPGKSKQEVPAPPNPPSTPLSVGDTPEPVSGIKLMSFGPLPASQVLSLTIHADEAASASLVIFSSNAVRVADQQLQLPAGISTLAMDLSMIPQGRYMVTIRSGRGQILLPIVVKK